MRNWIQLDYHFSKTRIASINYRPSGFVWISHIALSPDVKSRFWGAVALNNHLEPISFQFIPFHFITFHYISLHFFSLPFTVFCLTTLQFHSKCYSSAIHHQSPIIDHQSSIPLSAIEYFLSWLINDDKWSIVAVAVALALAVAIAVAVYLKNARQN